VCGIILSGSAIKLLDNLLDGDTLLPPEKRLNLTAYTILFLAMGTALSPSYAAALFLAAYAVGMVKAGDDIFPLGFGSMESAAILLFSLLFIGGRTFLFSLAVMMAVQLADDLADVRRDKLHGQDNLAVRFGTVEAVLALLITSLSALTLDAVGTVLVIASVPVSLCIATMFERKMLC
jgi:1,4-dihydroxy-2-naphthoate octaprenyltransferase